MKMTPEQLDRQKRKREILAFVKIKDKKICPVDGEHISSLNKDCDICELCEDFQNYVWDHWHAKFHYGRLVLVENTNGKWKRTPEILQKTAETKKKIKQTRINRIEEAVNRRTEPFDYVDIAREINETEGFVILILRQLKKQGKIQKKVINLHDYKFVLKKQKNK